MISKTDLNLLWLYKNRVLFWFKSLNFEINYSQTFLRNQYSLFESEGKASERKTSQGKKYKGLSSECWQFFCPKRKKTQETYGFVLAVVSSVDSVASPPPGSPSSPWGTTEKIKQFYKLNVTNYYMSSIKILYGITASSQLPNQHSFSKSLNHRRVNEVLLHLEYICVSYM